MRFTPALRALGAAVLAAAGLTVVPGTAHAATFVPCSTSALITAITNANTAGGDSLALAANCTYTLAAVNNSASGSPNGLPVITENISITGVNSTIQRSTAPGTPEFRIFEIDPPDGNLTLTGVTVRNGDVTTSDTAGGGIWLNDGGTLRLVNSTVTGNKGADDGAGGIESTDGTITILNSTISNNTGEFGAGLDLNSGSVATLSNVRITGNTSANSGGGIWSESTVTLTNTVLSQNTALFGGGLRNSGTATLTNVTLDHNTATDSGSAGAGIYTGGFLTATNTRITDNTATDPDSQGGGIYNAGSTTLRTTTITRNSAGDGGGIYNDSTVNLVGSSVTANTPNNCAPTGSVPGCIG
ncbi:right-handed parallel beta-helix repeat-containing protein [Streptomyces sp. NPDC048636]|uniref:right-handed parallel beta-helix repeat-containing protein n=1 Tax=Streptomyces sp. NPDC048636 TaxID=3155762 RepID=UPI0034453C21